MSYFGSIFRGNTDDVEQQQQQEEQCRLTRAQARAQANHLDIPAPPPGIPSFNGIARGRRTPSPRPVGHNDNSAVIFAYDSTNVSQRILRQSLHSQQTGRRDNKRQGSSL